MRNKRIIWAAAALMLLAGLSGCQKSDYSGKEIRFNARSLPEVGTKAVYTGDKNDSNFERINWEVGDKIRIYNDKATCSGDASYYWADYTVGSVESSSNRFSTGRLNVLSDRGGLTWGEGTHTFYGVYPSPETDDAAGTQDLSSFTGSIQQTQTGEPSAVDAWAGTGKVYYPFNNKPILVGYQQLAAESTGTLDFSPAYSAFHISAGVQEDMTVKSVELRSASHKLWGNFTVSRSVDTWNFTCPTASVEADKTVTFTLPGGGVDITTSVILELVLFTLPQELNDLTLAFNVTVGGTPKTLTLELKHANSSPVTFTACKKSYIKGLLIPGSTWTVNDTTPVVLRESVADWDDNTQNPNYGTGLVVNASGLDEVNLGTHSYRFSIYEPEGKTWKIKVLNSSGAVVPGVTITRNNHPGTADPTSGSGELTGTIRKGLATAPSLIEFSLSGSTGGSNCTLSFSVVADEKEYSINSEVVRGTWGTDYGYINL